MLILSVVNIVDTLACYRGAVRLTLLMEPQVSYASLCMDANDLEGILGEKQKALEKVEHAVAQKHLDPPKVNL